jgi:hypothetical protein
MEYRGMGRSVRPDGEPRRLRERSIFRRRHQGAWPVGGGQAGVNWQVGPWVYGVEGDASYTTLRGDNTCFSGLGGINCEHVVNSLATLAGRAGFAWDRSLLYLKGGGAWTNTTFNLDGNTYALSLGQASSHIDTLG